MRLGGRGTFERAGSIFLLSRYKARDHIPEFPERHCHY